MALQEDGTIIIDSQDFIEGMKASPFLGMGALVNLDIHSSPGVARIAYKLEKISGSTVDNKVRFLDVDFGTSSVFGLDTGGQLYDISSNGTVTEPASFGSSDDGMFVWKDYVFIMRADSGSINIDYYGALSSSPSKTTGWETPSSSAPNISGTFPTFVTASDIVYIGAGRYLHELSENAGQDFDPATGATYTLSEEALVLPEGYIITSVDQIGTNIVVGTKYESSQNTADIFIWNPNKSGTDAADADIRIQLSGSAVHNLIVSDVIHAIVGDGAQLILSDGTNNRQLTRINDFTSTPDDEFALEALPSEFLARFNGGVLMGMGKASTQTDANIFYYKDEKWSSFTTSAGTPSAGITIGALFSVSEDTFLVAWEDESSPQVYGIDVYSKSVSMGSQERYQDYSAYFESRMYRVGRPRRAKTYQHVGFKLTKPLVADQGIRIKYRENIGDSWTTMGTWDFANYGAINGYEDRANMLTNLENVQLRVEMTTGTSDNTPELLEVYLI